MIKSANLEGILKLQFGKIKKKTTLSQQICFEFQAYTNLCFHKDILPPEEQSTLILDFPDLSLFFAFLQGV